MSTEQLPDGLQLAVRLIGVARDHAIFDVQRDQCATAEDEVRAEHHQRVTLHHHACDLEQRIAALEAERDRIQSAHDNMARAWRADRNDMRLTTEERDELRVKHDELLVALHGIGKALGIPEGDRSPYSVMCGALERANRLAEIEAQEPVATAWITGGRMVNAFNHPPRSDFDPDGRWAEIGYSQRPLYARPVPAQAVPDKWRLVPVEPTIAMCIAGDSPRMLVDDCTPTPAIYRAMIAAAPEHKA